MPKLILKKFSIAVTVTIINAGQMPFLEPNKLTRS